MTEAVFTPCSAQEREQRLTALYKELFPAVAKYVSKRGGTLEQAKDVFHDALITWYEQSERSNNTTLQNHNAYVFGIAKHMWYRKFATDNSTIALENLPELEYDTADGQVSNNRLLGLLENTGKKCIDMLKAFYYDKLSMMEIASGFGFKTVHSATVQKYKCLEKVRETVKEKSLCYEDFLE